MPILPSVVYKNGESLCILVVVSEVFALAKGYDLVSFGCDILRFRSDAKPVRANLAIRVIFIGEHELKVCNKLGAAVGVELAVIVDDVAVIV